MAQCLFILGDSGSGKSTSLRNLNPEEVFILQAIKKQLPFKGWKKNYTVLTRENPSGNLGFSPDYKTAIHQLKYISEKTNKKIVIVDDSNYLMTNDFMSRVMEKATKGDVFSKYNEMAYNFHNLTKVIENLRDDLTVVLMAHTQTNDDGNRTFKTIGKLLDDKIKLEGLVSIILETKIKDGRYVFQTNKIDGSEPCKTPLEMFDDIYIDNDLQDVINVITDYENE